MCTYSLLYQSVVPQHSETSLQQIVCAQEIATALYNLPGVSYLNRLKIKERAAASEDQDTPPALCQCTREELQALVLAKRDRASALYLEVEREALRRGCHILPRLGHQAHHLEPCQGNARCQLVHRHIAWCRHQHLHTTLLTVGVAVL